MDLFKDCEIQRMHLRGTPVALIVGDRAASQEEGAALLAQYAASFGRSTAVPAYVSPDGWQLLKQKAVFTASPAAAQDVAKLLADVPTTDETVSSETKPAEPASNTPESATQTPESESKGPDSATKPAEPETLARHVIHAQHKKGGR